MSTYKQYENGGAGPLAHFLTQGRKARDMTQAALAAAIGIKRQQHISNFECGQSKPTRNQLDRICVALDLDRDEAHALLGQLPLDVEAAWLSDDRLRFMIRRMMRDGTATYIMRSWK